MTLEKICQGCRGEIKLFENYAIWYVPSKSNSGYPKKEFYHYPRCLPKSVLAGRK